MTPILSTALLRTQSDDRLVALVRAGHERAFDALVERYRRPLHAHCRRILPADRAEDAVQQSLLSAWSALRAGADVHDLRAWLHRIARNAALNARRRSGYDYDELRESLEGADAPEADLERRAVMRETLAGLAALPERQREALLRIAVEGRSHAEVAGDLGVSDGAVRQLVHRARATLRSGATAVTPLPLAAWLASSGPAAAPAGQRIAELAAAGGAAAAATLAKSGAVVLVVGAVAGGVAVERTAGADDGVPEGASASHRAGAAVAGEGPTGSALRARESRARGSRRRGREPSGATGSGRGPERDERATDDRSGDGGRSGEGGGHGSGETGDRSGPGGGSTSGDADRSGPGGGDRLDQESGDSPGSGGSGSGGGGRSGRGGGDLEAPQG